MQSRRRTRRIYHSLRGIAGVVSMGQLGPGSYAVTRQRRYPIACTAGSGPPRDLPRSAEPPGITMITQERGSVMASRFIVKIAVEKLTKLKLDLYSGNPFGLHTPITQAEVRHEMQRQIETGERFKGGVWNTRGLHVARVATLVLTGWTEPITIDLSASSCDWPIADGNHRLAAAVLLGDAFIDALVLGEEQLTRHLLSLPGSPNRTGTASSHIKRLSKKA